jgi:DNA-binding transcriptional LysR family regulator
MEFHQVRYCVALYKNLNFTRAAEACHVTQPALTRAIQKLEDELGGPLFERERNLTQLTELGRLMRPLLEQTLAAAEAAKAQATQFRKRETGSLRIGLPPSISARVVTSSVGELMRRIPGLNLELVMADEVELMENLLQGEADAAFVSGTTDRPDRLTTWTMFKERFHLGMSAAHPLARSEIVAVSALAGQTLLGRRDCAATAALHKLCAEADPPLQLRHLGGSEEHLQQLAASGLGLVLVPHHLPLLSGIATRPLADVTFERTVQLAVVGGRRFSPALDSFIKLSRTRDFATEFALG